MERSRFKKRRLEEFLEERRPAAVSEEIWRELVALLSPISESYLRDLLQGLKLPVAQPFGGVRQSSFKELEASLLEIESAYAKAMASGDMTRAKACRRVVIQAKDRARIVSRNEKVDPEKRTEGGDGGVDARLAREPRHLRGVGRVA